jgi:hypothetical protein
LNDLLFCVEWDTRTIQIYWPLLLQTLPSCLRTLLHVVCFRTRYHFWCTSVEVRSYFDICFCNCSDSVVFFVFILFYLYKTEDNNIYSLQTIPTSSEWSQLWCPHSEWYLWWPVINIRKLENTHVMSAFIGLHYIDIINGRNTNVVYPCIPVFSSNKSDHCNITDILLKLSLSVRDRDTFTSCIATYNKSPMFYMFF